MLEYADPELMVHPARDELTDARIQEILECIETSDTTDITADELEAVLDIMYDAVAGRLQTHSGVTTIQ